MAGGDRFSEESIIQGYFAQLAAGATGNIATSAKPGRAGTPGSSSSSSSIEPGAVEPLPANPIDPTDPTDHAGVLNAFGLRDDCATIAPPAGMDLVVKTDPLREGVHFFPDDPPGDIGWKALAVNVSDLAAKAATPLAYVMALSFPAMPEETWLQDFAKGLGAAQRSFGMHLIGGDTDRAPGPVSIAITVFGMVPRGRMLRRGTAQPGDLLFVSGTLGDSALGLLLRQHIEAAYAWKIADSERHFLIDRYLRPRPVLALREALQQCARASMDLSDGLLKDLGRMCQASSCQDGAAGRKGGEAGNSENLGARIRFADIPLSAAAAGALHCDPGLRAAIVASGDDYEILTAIPPDKAAAFKSMARDAETAVTQIGEITGDGKLLLAAPDGAPMQLDSLGWDHFGSARA